MKQMMRLMGAVFSGPVLLAWTLGAAAGQATQTPGVETYIVRPGDTLSGIAGRVFGDSKRWREILKANPQVTNANRIYPGDSLLVPASQTAAPAAAGHEGLTAREGAAGAIAGSGAADKVGAGSGADAVEATVVTKTDQESTVGAKPAAVPEPSLPVERAGLAAVVNPALYRSAGYIAGGLPEIGIVASPDGRILLGSGDEAIINATVSPGSRFSVVRADRRIFHPSTKEPLGWLTRVLGSAEVTCRGERTSTVVLHGLRDAASIGDYLVPFNPNDVLADNRLAGKAKTTCIAPGPADAMIVAFDDDRRAGGEQDFAYVDRGTGSGIVPGKLLTVYREGDRDALVMVGELQVLRAGERTATALITTSIKEVEVGDLLRVR